MLSLGVTTLILEGLADAPLRGTPSFPLISRRAVSSPSYIYFLREGRIPVSSWHQLFASSFSSLLQGFLTLRTQIAGIPEQYPLLARVRKLVHLLVERAARRGAPLSCPGG